jgi:hypothetical protein
MDLHIELNEEVKGWIRSKGNQVTVKTIEVNSCCAPGVQDLFAYPGKPKDLHNYEEFQEEDLSIFIQKHLTSKQLLSFKLSGFSIFKTISAKLQL